MGAALIFRAHSVSGLVALARQCNKPVPLNILIEESKNNNDGVNMNGALLLCKKKLTQ